ncbi:MAG TPA: PfkB family carbohydrate kinase [Sedimentisphaerales bacterium]|nr:PfkB family carbohydrate kinase [Sedimentisphaerales bacterium]
MRQRNSIITIGLSPAWDITCRGRNIDWGLHQEIDEQTVRPAGKALNVSKALAWMGQRNIAAGLWGSGDHEQMLAAVRSLWPSIRVKLTAVAGGTRKNITIVDSARNKEMHLRNKSRLASAKTLKKLHTDLKAIVHEGGVCVLAGTMPDGGLLDDVVRLVELCRSRGAKIVLDTSGRPLKEIINTGSAWLIKPNVEELCELLGEQIKDGPVSLAKAGRKLLDKVEIVLISRGARGGVVVTKNGAWQGRCTGREKVFSTVGCGDFLLAGFLKALEDGSGTDLALKTAIKVATARAWGWTEKMSWPDVKSRIHVQVGQI